MKRYSVAVTADGSGAGSGSVVIAPGLLCGILVIRGDATLTTDVTITEVVGGVSRSILALTNIPAIESHMLAVPAEDATGTDIAGATLPVPVYGGALTVTVAQSANNVVTTVVFIIGD